MHIQIVAQVSRHVHVSATSHPVSSISLPGCPVPRFRASAWVGCLEGSTTPCCCQCRPNPTLSMPSSTLAAARRYHQASVAAHPANTEAPRRHAVHLITPHTSCPARQDLPGGYDQNRGVHRQRPSWRESNGRVRCDVGGQPPTELCHCTKAQCKVTTHAGRQARWHANETGGSCDGLAGTQHRSLTASVPTDKTHFRLSGRPTRRSDGTTQAYLCEYHHVASLTVLLEDEILVLAVAI